MSAAAELGDSYNKALHLAAFPGQPLLIHSLPLYMGDNMTHIWRRNFHARGLESTILSKFFLHQSKSILLNSL